MASEQKDRVARGHRPKCWSPRWFKWILSLYPPFLLGGIRLVAVAEDFSSCRVRVRRTLLNRNLNGTVFGGTLYSAADPIYAVLFWQYFAHEGLGLRVWTRSARVEFLAPVRRAVELDFRIEPEVAGRARAALLEEGVFAEAFLVRALDGDGNVAVEVETAVHLKRR